MSEITFLASSRPFIIPHVIEEYNQRMKYRTEEDYMFFSVQIADEAWLEEVQGLFSLPYLYVAEGVGNRIFLTYLEKYMEIGDVIEVYSVPNQHALSAYREKFEEDLEYIEVNAGSYTYRDRFGFFQFNPKKWIEELSNRNYMRHNAVTTFIKY
ncbi:hypothetical protein [Planococcus alpniumensis]|uniref:hypothetical protein n=1 Tax=Planococcus alpniumensis TaxID=2708345 RepID=UPI001B8CA002|nr:hypothetical protein [Planococcus sp. MSAK28401]